MKVAMLAAGVGRRLGLADAPAKALLRFDGESLLKRHLDILAHFGLLDLTLAVGHQAGAIEQELSAIGARDRVRTCSIRTTGEPASCRSGRCTRSSPPGRPCSTWTRTCFTTGGCSSAS
jgi:CTP:molybdopterin cytidylyltransferase MocA